MTEQTKLTTGTTDVVNVRSTLEQGMVKLRASLEAARALGPTNQALEATTVGISKCRRAAALTKRTAASLSASAKRELDAVKAVWRPLLQNFESMERAFKLLGDAILQAQREERERTNAEALQQAEQHRKEREAADERAKAAATSAERREAELEGARAFRSERRAMDQVRKPVPTGVKTDAGTLYPVETWGWTVEKLEDVPDEWKMLVMNEAKVDEAIKGGVRDIKGLKIFSRSVSAFRGR